MDVNTIIPTSRQRRRRRTLPLALRACVGLLAMAIPGPAGAQARGVALRLALDQRGDFVLVGNSVHTCSGGSACTIAQVAGGSQDNNDFSMVYVDVDGDAATFNSSMATLALPAGATVSAARLYWFCTTGRGTAPPDPTKRNQVLFKKAGDSYVTVTASVFDGGLSAPPAEAYGSPYMGQADVTQEVTGAGDYWVADMQCGHDSSGLFSDWTLAVAYADPSAPVRAIRLYDGYDQASPGNDVAFTLSGLLTPAIGPVDAHIGVVLGDGDAGLTGDGVSLAATALHDVVNPSSNFGNSTVSRFGLRVTTRSPNYVNTLGFDADVLETTNVLPNGATSAALVLHAGGENLFAGVFGVATDVSIDLAKVPTLEGFGLVALAGVLIAAGFLQLRRTALS